jgi:predicted enzyme related to lactoylglutathione lyase
MFGFAHVELPAKNLQREGQFYSVLFQWKMQEFYGDDYRMIVTADGDMIGGLTKVDQIIYNDAYIVFVEVDNVDRMIAAAEKIGGSRAAETRDLPEGMGSYSKIKTPDGYCIGVWSKK